MIPNSGTSPMLRGNGMLEPQSRMVGSIPGGANRQGAINATPLQTMPLLAGVTYPPPTNYQQPEQLTISNSKDSNENLLLTLTKKMEELAVNMAKDKEKKQKSSNARTNIWCSNCQGQGHYVTECSAPQQTVVLCMYCGGKHPTQNCWHWKSQQQHNNSMMIQPTVWDVNQVQTGNMNNWNGNRPNQGNRSYGPSQNTNLVRVMDPI